MKTEVSNPLLSINQNPVPPFDRIKPTDFEPAFETAIGDAKGKVAAILANPQAATFENTIEALEYSTEDLDPIALTFSNLLHAETAPELHELSETVLPKLSEFSSDLYLNPALFARVKAVYDASKAGTLKLTTEQQSLLKKTYKAFVRNGSQLEDAEKEQLREIDQKLVLLAQKYGDQVRKATQAFRYTSKDKAELAGLPESIVEAAYTEGKKDDPTGSSFTFTLDQPCYIPFMKFSSVRRLREKLWRANMSRCNGGEFDNRPLILEIVSLKHERAQILGFKDYASYELEERMAENSKNVDRFLERLLNACVKAARAEFQELQEFARKIEPNLGELKPWDSAYYTEKLKLEQLDFDEQELKPYFELKSVVEGAFEVARRLYGLEFKKRTDLPAYHSEVETFEVTDPKLGSGPKAFVGLLCFDLHPRTTKRGGAWMTTFLDEGFNQKQGKILRPVVSIVASLTRPTETKPALLDLNEVRTVFHEFGHALHGLLTQARYRSLSGTNVYWDFVELPSQVMENWTRHPDGLALFARHYETGKPMPKELMEKIKKVSRFQAGLTSLRQLNFAKIDMTWHAGPPHLPSVEGVEAFERDHLKATMLFEHVPGTMISTSFSHIFSGGYSAGYYSYKWAEVLDADAFEAFQETALFDPKTASLFRKEILEKGGTEPPQELYRMFRGRDPDPDALLRRDGLIG